MLSAPLTRRRFLVLGSAGVVTVASSGCGTILYPERVGQPCGPLDWRVVGLNTIGLLFFFIPGLIAFAVDFWNGTIYLPVGYPQEGEVISQRKLRPISVPHGELTPEKVEQLVSRHLQQPVQLRPGQYQHRELANMEQFWPVHDHLTGTMRS